MIIFIKKVLKNTSLLTVLLIILTLVFNCAYDTGSSSKRSSKAGDITLNFINGNSNDTDSISYYRITGVGPGKAQLDQTTDLQSVLLENLTAGNWNITVQAFDGTDYPIAGGDGEISIINNELSKLDINIAPLTGEGYVDIVARWDSTSLPTATIEAKTFSYSGGEEVIALEMSHEGSITRAQKKLTLSAGYHTIIIKLINNNKIVAGAVEFERIIPDQTLIREFQFESTGDPRTAFIIDDDLVPVNSLRFNLDASTNIVNPGNTMQVTASLDTVTTSPAEAGTIIYNWFINDVFINDGNSITLNRSGLDFTMGNYVLRMIAITADGKRIGIAEHDFAIMDTMPTPTPPLVNLALNKAAVVSSTYTNIAGFDAVNLTDGDETTIWGTALSTQPQWAYIDLGQSVAIKQIVLKWFDDYYPTNFRIAVSGDTTTWNFIYETTDGTGADVSEDVDLMTRYVGIYLTTGPRNIYALKEFEINAYEQ